MGLGYGNGIGWIIGLIILIGVVWLIAKVVNQNSNAYLPNYKLPLDILKARYASGEISKEEYEEKNGIFYKLFVRHFENQIVI